MDRRPATPFSDEEPYEPPRRQYTPFSDEEPYEPPRRQYTPFSDEEPYEPPRRQYTPFSDEELYEPPRRQYTPFSDEEPYEPPRRQDTPTGYRSDEDDVRSSWSRTSSRSSVDSMLIEQFSCSDSSSNPSLRGPQPSASNLESADNRGPARGFISKLGRGVGRSAAKRKATRLLDELIQANNTRNGQATARQRRYKAATGLVEIIKNKPDGEDIVARRFVKSALRQDQGTQALLRLSDDELDLFGSKAVSPVPEPLAFTKLLTVVVKHTSESQFFRRTVSTALRAGKEGVAAILYLATTETRNFFLNIDYRVLVDFCDRIVTKEAPSCLKWLCGAKLLGIIVRERGNSIMTWPLPTMAIVRSVCTELIRTVTETLGPSVSRESRRDPVTGDTALLYIIAVCFDAMSQGYHHQSYFPNLHFINWLISLINSGYGTSQSLNIKSAFALSTLRSLVQNNVAVTAISGDTLSKLGAMFLDMALYRPALDIREAGFYEKSFLRDLKANLDERCLLSLGRLPQYTFSDALASALSKGITELNSLETRNPYKSLNLVERLLWLSNLKIDLENRTRVLRALVCGGACAFLTVVLSYTGDLSPWQARGLWRAKGLAVTCLGNIFERMNGSQLHNHATKEIIGAVVAIKEHEDVPLVQKGQAIFTLQRYTLAADRWGIRPHYREDTSDMDEGFRIPSSLPVLSSPIPIATPTSFPGSLPLGIHSFSSSPSSSLSSPRSPSGLSAGPLPTSNPSPMSSPSPPLPPLSYSFTFPPRRRIIPRSIFIFPDESDSSSE